MLERAGMRIILRDRYNQLSNICLYLLQESGGSLRWQKTRYFTIRLTHTGPNIKIQIQMQKETTGGHPTTSTSALVNDQYKL